eukprot:TRINITY_DN33058_c0_g1_i1.p1 TRINITY_DN33058_c0_g1~~TRINITY_DN33058_c0_g1_i1.p1  ORF type:complete len:637 (-),score=109.94 TRINITY_DN33058_c0_g1_i1:55-1965(-)
MGACHTHSSESDDDLSEVSRDTHSELPQCLAEDGRVLASFASFLHRAGRQEELLDLWALEIAAGADGNAAGAMQSDSSDDDDSHAESAVGISCSCSSRAQRKLVQSKCSELAHSLASAWEEYEQSPEGRGNFDDTREWIQHDFPGANIMNEIGDGASRDDSEDHENHAFSIKFSLAAMIGIHVSIVCSDLVANWAIPAGGAARCEEAFRKRFPMLSLEKCIQHQVRRFQVNKAGSAFSPATCIGNFHIEEFAPRFFSEVRCCCGIRSADFFESVCRTDFEYIEFGSNSKSGELFFFTHDSKYLLKTASAREAEVLINMLPRYLQRLEDEPRSLLGRYLGLYRVTLPKSEPRLFLVMRAVTSHTVPITHSYDIKGSSRGRKAPASDKVGKDVNFDEEMGSKISLPEDVATEVAEIHREDTELLQEFRVMDYSLLLQIHDKGDDLLRWREQARQIDEGSKRRRTRAVSLNEADGNKLRSSVRLVSAPVTRRTLETSLTRVNTFAAPEMAVRLSSHAFEMPQRVESRDSLDTLVSCAGDWMRRGSARFLPCLPVSAPASNWLPNDGSLVSKDGMMVYTMGLIDMLVPYTTYPKLQYCGMEIITCGRGTKSSRVPPDLYGRRQIKKVHAMCGLDAPDGQS